MSHTKVVLLLVSVSVFGVMHFPKDYLPNVRLLNSKSTQQRIENVQNLGNLYRMATEMTTTESLESLHLDRIIDLLIDFLKLHGTNEHICAQVIELVTIFQRAIQIKAKLFQRLKRTFLMMRTLKEIPSGITNSLHDQFVCVQRFTSCMDLDMVARKLASPRVDVVTGVVETLLPYVKSYATELDACVSMSESQ